MRRLVSSFVLLTAFALPLRAQVAGVVWTARSDLAGELPASIEVFETDNTTLRAWYVKADPTDPAWEVRALLAEGGAQPLSTFADESEAWVAVNGGYFGGSQTFSLVAEDGRVFVNNIGSLTRPGQTFYPTRSAFAVLDDGTPDVAWIYNVGGTTYAYPAPSPNQQGQPQPQPTTSFPEGGAPWPLGTGIGGGPVLVQDGQVALTWEEEVFFGSGVDLGVRRARTAVGYTEDGDVLLLSVAESGGATLTETAQLMADLGAVEAVNLDGGGSSSLIAGGTTLNATSRAVTSALVFAPPRDVTTGVQGVIYDTGDACCYRETGDWFESANEPFHGTTPSRLNEVGTGGDRAVFVFDGLAAGRYDLSAWWVASFNRAVDTPFTVYHDGTPTVVEVDQSDAGTLNKWNALGTFDLAPGDSVVVTDAATAGAQTTYVAVDALRLVRVRGVAAETLPAVPRLALAAFPNPTEGAVTLAWEASRPGSVEGRIVDVLGRTVQRFAHTAGRGPQRLALDLPGLAAGLYWVEVRAPGQVARTSLFVR